MSDSNVQIENALKNNPELKKKVQAAVIAAVEKELIAANVITTKLEISPTNCVNVLWSTVCTA